MRLESTSTRLEFSWTRLEFSWSAMESSSSRRDATWSRLECTSQCVERRLFRRYRRRRHLRSEERAENVVRTSFSLGSSRLVLFGSPFSVRLFRLAPLSSPPSSARPLYSVPPFSQTGRLPLTRLASSVVILS